MAHIFSAIMNRIAKNHSSKCCDIKAHETVEDSPDVHFEPIVKLALIDTHFEDDEDVLLSLRAKLFRYDLETVPASWKERGTGQCQILKHKASGLIRILMRRNNTMKICANHYIYPYMELKPNCGSDQAWVWSTVADYAEAKNKEHILAIRFANSIDGKKFKSVFDLSAEEMKKVLQTRTLAAEEKVENNESSGNDDCSDVEEGDIKAQEKAADEVTGKLKGLKVTSSIAQLASASC